MKRVAIVTGAAGGIGFGIVERLVKDGYCVVGNVFNEADFKEKFEKLGPNALCLEGDISSSTDRKALIDYTISKFGQLDLLVNVAGVAPNVRNDILDMTEDSYDRVMNINTKGTMFLTQLAAKQMISQGNDVTRYIINISSMSAYTSSTSRGEYCISKAGVSMVTKLFADRLASENIVVNEIRPGIIHTNMTSTVQAKYDKLIGDGLLPIKRWGQPEDIAKAVSALCSGMFDYTTGQSIDVDGGFHIQRL